LFRPLKNKKTSQSPLQKCIQGSPENWSREGPAEHTLGTTGMWGNKFSSGVSEERAASLFRVAIRFRWLLKW